MKQIRKLDRNGKLILLAFVLAVLLLVYAILYLFFLHDLYIKWEIFRYVRDHQVTIAVEPLNGYQKFVYYQRGFLDSEMEIGYYFSEDDRYRDEGGCGFDKTTYNSYKNGCRFPYHGANGPLGWYYTEKICENWYYYELHDG